MGDEGRTDAAAPHAAQAAAPATKKRAREGADTGDLKRLAEIVMVLAAMREMRGGREPTAAEKALVAEAREKLVGMCEHVKPKDLFSRESVRVVVDDLGLNRSKDPLMGCRPPKMSIAEKVLLTKTKMEESKEVATHSPVYSSHHLPVSFGANIESHGTLLHGASRFVAEKPIAVALPAGGFQSTSAVSHVPTLVSVSSSKQLQINETYATVTPIKSASNPHQRDSPSLTPPHAEPGHLRLDARLNGPTYQTQVQATSAEYMPHKAPTTSMQSTSAAVTKVGQAHKLLDHALVKSDSIHEVNAIQNSQATRHQEIRSSAIQAGQGNLRMGHQPSPGLAFVHAPSPFNNHDDIATNVQRILHQKVSNHPSWVPSSTEYMNRPLNCQVCKITISDMESLLVCDACEKGTHLKCLQSYANKGNPKAEWHCTKCLISSNGKPLPPKYGRVTRAVGPAKGASNAGITHASSEKKTVNTDSKVNQQKAIANGNSGISDLARPSNMGDSHAESSPSSEMNVAEVQFKSPAPGMKGEDGMSKGASTNHSKENAGVVCIISGAQNDNSGSSSHDMKVTSESVLQPKTVPEISCSDHPRDIVVHNTNQSQLSGDSLVGDGVKLPSDVEASAIRQQEFGKPGDDELKKPFGKKETSENRASSKSRLDDGDNSQATSNGALNYGDEARDHGRPLLPDLHAVDWVGDILQVVDEKTYYQYCRINGILYKLQDHVLIASTCQKFVPSKLQSLWEDNKSGSKWATVDLYYFPNDLAGTVSQPSTTENSEVYASNNKKTIMAGSINGPCEV
ncbi:uncharacterized protein LOC103713628 [Phoenix dactylifera]|uniref:Uncharacterized protein LOC103713628 n=1 Tax=Phoenix dactylifera TaxID=42345 RepID=A0A8B7MV77_PHODC|nr:uncharacterized protein LOC103713628 [Phoenix dactylifera]XP_017699882.2 uncharacterized protein LOC103713628 [Phoenix dactylifera]